MDCALLEPINIIAVWNGGMAVFGTIIVGALTLYALVPRYGLSRQIAVDGGALFAVVGQIFGRVDSPQNATQLCSITNTRLPLIGEPCAAG